MRARKSGLHDDGGYKMRAGRKDFLRGFSVGEFLWVEKVNRVSHLGLAENGELIAERMIAMRFREDKFF
jgi:hypothetical protein